jgi:CubicO group peptidase (beta-lactamase class C family)
VALRRNGAFDAKTIDALIQSILKTARIPGAAIAIVSHGDTLFTGAYGVRDLTRERRITPETVYPIASTTKGMNATLLGMLVEDGRLEWDAKVQTILPAFQLADPIRSAQVTVRDLLVMRTGLPRHDWLWIEHPTDRADLVRRLAHLDLSAGFRDVFQYNNLTSSAAGHLAEVICGRPWEDQIRERILEPLGMKNTTFGQPATEDATLAYHENVRRQFVETPRLLTELTAPSGGSIHSTVVDMVRWMLLNLGGGEVDGHQLIGPSVLREIHTPCVIAGIDAAAPSPIAAYALGWFVDVYRGCRRISHGGYLDDVNSSVMLFPDEQLGLVSFTNFGGPRLADTINQVIFDVLRGYSHDSAVRDKLAAYETKIRKNGERIAGVRRVVMTTPSHPLDDYTGRYEHPGYGHMQIRRRQETLVLERGNLRLSLEHWHYDAWIASDHNWFGIESPHVFDRASRILFEADADGQIASFTMDLEPKVAPVRFHKCTGHQSL